MGKDKILALMALAIAVHHKIEVHYDAPYYAVPTALLPRLWNVGDAKMQCLFQGLLDNGFVCYKEIVPNDAVNSKGTTAQSYILIHILVARFLNSILPSSHQLQVYDGGRGRHANFLVDTPGCQNSNRLQIADVAGTSYVKLTNDIFPRVGVLDFYFCGNSNDFHDCYKILMEAAKHENPLEELYRRRNEMPSQIWESSYNDKFVTGLEKATSYMKGRVEAEQQKRIFLAGGKPSDEMGVQYECVASFEQNF